MKGIKSKIHPLVDFIRTLVKYGWAVSVRSDAVVINTNIEMLSEEYGKKHTLTRYDVRALEGILDWWANVSKSMPEDRLPMKSEKVEKLKN